MDPALGWCCRLMCCYACIALWLLLICTNTLWCNNMEGGLLRLSCPFLNSIGLEHTKYISPIHFLIT